MVTIGGNEYGSEHPASNRAPLLARVAGTLAATALIVSTASYVLAAPPAPKKTASQVAVNSAGGGGAISGGSLASTEVFKAGSQLNSAPSQYNHGSATGLVNPTDIKYSPANNFLAVANSSTLLGGGNVPFGGAFIYSSAVNGNQGPVQAMESPSTYIPDGVAWDAEGDLWVAYFATPSCDVTPPGQPATAPATCTTGIAKTAKTPAIPPSIDLCTATIGSNTVPLVGTIEEFAPNGSTLAAPNVLLPTPIRTIKSCSSVYTGATPDDPGPVIDSGIVEPTGMVVAEISVQVCVATDTPGEDDCGAFGGKRAYALGNYGVVDTHVIFVANSATGQVTAYEPELEEAIGNQFGFGKGLITEDFGTVDGTPDTIVEAMSPLGGFVGGSTQPGIFVDPQYIAFGAIAPSEEANGPQLLVSDAKGGPLGRGSIANVETASADAFCAQPFAAPGDECNVFVLGDFLQPVATSFIETNANKKVKDNTGLNSPEGIAALVTDNVLAATFVANPITGGFEQFAANVSGNVAAQVVVGGNTNISKMVAPWGLTIPGSVLPPIEESAQATMAYSRKTK